jgi:hypothetical protein
MGILEVDDNNEPEPENFLVPNILTIMIVSTESGVMVIYFWAPAP